MKKLIKNRYANFYLNAAAAQNLNYTILNEKVALARIYDSEKTLDLSANVLDLNSQLSSVLSTNKKKTSLLLREANIPVPDFKTFTDKILAEKYLLNKIKLSKSYVIKPLYGSLTIGITINPTTKNQAIAAIKEAFNENSEIIIEKYFPGHHYRITVLDDEVIAITQRIPAYVVGNSENTIHELITEKNITRKIFNLPLIVLRAKDRNYLKSKKIKVNKIYPGGEKMVLQYGCDFDTGGERVRIDRDSIPTVNTDLFIKAARTLGLRFAGIDYISPNILLPYIKVKSAINEINSAPHPDVHFRDTYPHDNYAAERVIEKVFRKEDVILKKPEIDSKINSTIHVPLHA